jgi:HK97 family phage prohead protease
MSLKNSKFFYGYASIFREKDLNGDVILPESFIETSLNPEIIPLFLEHDARKQIGVIEKIRQDNTGLYVEGMIEKEFAKKKIPLSIGYIPNFEMKSINGSRYISQIKLLEVSLVKKPANKKAFAFCV